MLNFVARAFAAFCAAGQERAEKARERRSARLAAWRESRAVEAAEKAARVAAERAARKPSRLAAGWVGPGRLDEVSDALSVAHWSAARNPALAMALRGEN